LKEFAVIKKSFFEKIGLSHPQRPDCPENVLDQGKRPGPEERKKRRMF
jgi:hypothetical protein